MYLCFLKIESNVSPLGNYVVITLLDTVVLGNLLKGGLQTRLSSGNFLRNLFVQPVNHMPKAIEIMKALLWLAKPIIAVAFAKATATIRTFSYATV
jgi:hypothetical protein